MAARKDRRAFKTKEDLDEYLEDKYGRELRQLAESAPRELPFRERREAQRKARGEEEDGFRAEGLQRGEFATARYKATLVEAVRASDDPPEEKAEAEAFLDSLLQDDAVVTTAKAQYARAHGKRFGDVDPAELAKLRAAGQADSDDGEFEEGSMFNPIFNQDGINDNEQERNTEDSTAAGES